MPYQHSKHAPVLREALRRLKGDKVSAQVLVNALIRAKRMPTGGQDISRPALAQFINSRDSKKIVALAALWDFLHEHPTYKTYFPDENPILPDTRSLIMGSIFARVCRAPEEYTWPPKNDDARFGFAGSFVMFTRPWTGKSGAKSLHVMEFKGQMEHASFTADITHRQPGGALVTYKAVLQEWELSGAKSVCFSGRQVGDGTGNLELAFLGLTNESSFAADGKLLLSWFKGGLCAAAQPGRFPFIHFLYPSGFYCRRPNLQMGDDAALERGEVTEIRDDDPAKARLLDLF